MGTPLLATRIDALYTGRVQLMPGDSRSTGIFKHPVAGPLQLSLEGLEGDEQADRRVHGGPGKALHHYAVGNYARLAQRYPELAAAFVPGALGENLSTPGLDESTVCIGDVFALGSARVQLNQPRRPCWKIDARFGRQGIAAFVEAQGLTGWYYRVLEPGRVAVGDDMVLLERAPGAPTLQRFHALVHAHRPRPADLLEIADLPALDAAWAERLRARALWLHHNGLLAEES